MCVCVRVWPRARSLYVATRELLGADPEDGPPPARRLGDIRTPADFHPARGPGPRPGARPGPGRPRARPRPEGSGSAADGAAEAAEGGHRQLVRIGRARNRIWRLSQNRFLREECEDAMS